MKTESYTEEQLAQVPYFAGLLKEKPLDQLLDALTGVVARPYIIAYVRYLVEQEIPFTFAILDLDNFKYTNDTYGHKAGDGVLKAVTADLRSYLEGIGTVGRFGGDEFLIVNLRDREYDAKKAFYEGMYRDFRVLRKTTKLPDCELFVTGTIGSATYPDDATDYDALFALIDKTLYRGKKKGRNCYIIYVEEKHKDIVIEKLAGHGLYTTFRNLAHAFDSAPELRGKLLAMYEVLQEDMRISNLYYIGRSRELRSVLAQEPLAAIYDIDTLMDDDMYWTNDIDDLNVRSPMLYQVLLANEIETVLIVRVSMEKETYGYLMCGEPHNRRIWQEDECAVLFSVGRMLAGYILGKGMTLE